MLRLSKTQKEIESLVPSLPKVTAEQFDWAKRNFTYFVIVRNMGENVRCPECGCRFAPNGQRKNKARWNDTDREVRCPHCGSILQVGVRDVYSSKMRNKQEDFFEVLQVVGEWQVTRLFYMRRYCYVRKENTPWEFYECCQAWNNPKYKTTYFRALDKSCMCTYHFNPYTLWERHYTYDEKEKLYVASEATLKELQPRRVGGANYFETNNVAPGAQVLPFYQQRGVTANAIRNVGRNAMWLFECVSLKRDNVNPMYETLLKANDYAMFNKITEEYHQRDFINALYTAWKICRRNGYKRSNDTEWFDLVSMLVDSKMDFHNPHYVCPANLHEAHQEMVRRKEREEERRREGEEMERRKNEADTEIKLAKRVARYLDMDIRGGGLHLVVLSSIKDFRDEGKALGHCVYSCAYYRKENSLLLSARGRGGKRWETIEVSLKDLTILQCYGYGDKFTEKHQEILDLVNSNMWQIKERRDGKKLAKAS